MRKTVTGGKISPFYVFDAFREEAAPVRILTSAPSPRDARLKTARWGDQGVCFGAAIGLRSEAAHTPCALRPRRRTRADEKRAIVCVPYRYRDLSLLLRKRRLWSRVSEREGRRGFPSARHRSTRGRMSAGLCCCCGGGADDAEERREAVGAGALGDETTTSGAVPVPKTKQQQQQRELEQQKQAPAPAGHTNAGLSPPTVPSMSTSSNAPVSGSPVSARGSDGDMEEFFDAPDSLEHLGAKWGPSSRSVTDLLDAAGIVLEQPGGGVGRCVIPRRDIRFDDPGAGEALSWSANPTGQGFKLRGKEYMKDKKKYPSASPLFDVVQAGSPLHRSLHASRHAMVSALCRSHPPNQATLHRSHPPNQVTLLRSHPPNQATHPPAFLPKPTACEASHAPRETDVKYFRL